jgi:hypothetical protein
LTRQAKFGQILFVQNRQNPFSIEVPSISRLIKSNLEILPFPVTELSILNVWKEKWDGIDERMKGTVMYST